MSDVIPEDYRDLVQRPLFAALGTVRPDNAPQVSAMWFDTDGDYLTFTHTTYRAKYRNLQQNPGMSLLIMDPDDPERAIEIRGRLVKIEPDATGAHYVHLGRRYGNLDQQPPPDAKDRVVLYMSIDKVLTH